MKHLEEVIINYDKKLMEANAEIKRLLEENERLHSIIEQIEGALYNTNLSNMYCRITIQEILDKENN